MRAALLAAAALITAAATVAPPGLYGLAPTTSALTRVFPNGTVVTVGAGLPGEVDGQQRVAIDPSAGLQYILGVDASGASPVANVVGVSLADGSVVSAVHVPQLAPGTIAGLGTAVGVDTATGRLAVMGYSSKGAHDVGWVAPANGRFTRVAALNASLNPVIGGTSAYDPVAAVFLVQLGDPITGITYDITVDMATGATTFTPEKFPTGADIQSLNYDGRARAFYGFGLAPNASAGQLQRAVMRMDAATLQIATVRG